MSERKIYEIAKLLNDRNNIEGDMAGAAEMVTGLFRDKYVKRLNAAFAKCRDSCEQNPSREVLLLKALKPFMPEENHKNLDNAAEMLILMETLNNIRNEANIIQAEEIKAGMSLKSEKNNIESNKRIISAVALNNTTHEDSAVHADGIYETDMNCMVKRPPAMPYAMMSVILAGILIGGGGK